MLAPINSLRDEFSVFNFSLVNFPSLFFQRPYFLSLVLLSSCQKRIPRTKFLQVPTEICIRVWKSNFIYFPIALIYRGSRSQIFFNSISSMKISSSGLKPTRNFFKSQKRYIYRRLKFFQVPISNSFQQDKSQFPSGLSAQITPIKTHLGTQTQFLFHPPLPKQILGSPAKNFKPSQ